LIKIFLLMHLSLVFLFCSTITFKTAAQNSAPKYFLNEDKKMSGLCIDIMSAISEIDEDIIFTGQNVFLPFKRMKKMLKEGEIDVFFGFVKNELREKEYVFINPTLYNVNHVLAKRKDDLVQVRSFGDIRLLGKEGKLITTFGTSTKRYLDKQGGLIIDDHGKSISANLKMLLRERGRFVYYHDLGLITTIKNEKLGEKIKVLPTSFRSYSQYVAFSKHMDKKSIEKLKKALEKLKKNGKLDKIFKKYVNIKY